MVNLACFERESKGAAGGCTALPQTAPRFARLNLCCRVCPSCNVIEYDPNDEPRSPDDAIANTPSTAPRHRAACEFVSPDFFLLPAATTWEPRAARSRLTLAMRCALCLARSSAAGAETLFGMDHSRRPRRFLPPEQAGKSVLRTGFTAPRTVEKASQNGSRHPLQAIFYRPRPSSVRQFRFCSRSVLRCSDCMKAA